MTTVSTIAYMAPKAVTPPNGNPAKPPMLKFGIPNASLKSASSVLLTSSAHRLVATSVVPTAYPWGDSLVLIWDMRVVLVTAPGNDFSMVAKVSAGEKTLVVLE